MLSTHREHIKENAELRVELDLMTQERDILKAQRNQLTSALNNHFCDRRLIPVPPHDHYADWKRVAELEDEVKRLKGLLRERGYFGRNA